MQLKTAPMPPWPISPRILVAALFRGNLGDDGRTTVDSSPAFASRTRMIGDLAEQALDEFQHALVGMVVEIRSQCGDGPCGLPSADR